MNCAGCKNWITREAIKYDDGTEITIRESPTGKGICGELKIETSSVFGCNAFAAGFEHIKTIKKSGHPWQHFVMIACPVCEGGPRCGGNCQCAGTGLVRKYDDGFIGDEKTRLHPKERGSIPDIETEIVSSNTTLAGGLV